MNSNEYISVLNSDLRIIKGIGEKKSAFFAKMGIYSIWDLIYTFPRTYEDRCCFYTIEAAPLSIPCCVEAVIRGAVIEKRLKKTMSLYILRVEDSTGIMNIKWFSSPFNKHKLKRGMRYSFYGTVELSGSVKEMTLREMEPYGEQNLIGRIVPIYALTHGLTQKDFRKAIGFAMEKVGFLHETLPVSLIESNSLMTLWDAVCQMHTPNSTQELEIARYRLAFEELFILNLAMRHMRIVNNITTNILPENIKCAAEFAVSLPFELTADQKKVINEMCMDFKSGKPMNRLVQGDVGSGKTVVAACGAYIMAKNGYQTAFMAPTEILANQHFCALKNFFENTGISVGILTGSSKSKTKILEDISSGAYDVVIGTHALIEDRVKFAKLGLCITDEQHRFGVKQRARLSKNGAYPHVLVMSATPIPRTLSLVVYGDLDVSVITAVPSGRQKIDTFCVNESMRSRLNSFIEKQVNAGYQCFVVCPLIEESDKIDALSGAEIFEKLKVVFPQYNIAFLHGKMSVDEKDEIMQKFRDKVYQILVSTTVIEVGIDVPNANLMIIENAERFGLSQLHQLRGRVGRGSVKSYCVLVSETKTDDAKERMKIMCDSSDGFEIAQKDLAMRGCGEFFGTRQHGIPELKVANLFTDLPIVEHARKVCDKILETDPNLTSETFSHLKARIDKIFKDFGCLEIFN